MQAAVDGHKIRTAALRDVATCERIKSQKMHCHLPLREKLPVQSYRLSSPSAILIAPCLQPILRAHQNCTTSLSGHLTDWRRVPSRKDLLYELSIAKNYSV